MIVYWAVPNFGEFEPAAEKLFQLNGYTVWLKRPYQRLCWNVYLLTMPISKLLHLCIKLKSNSVYAIRFRFLIPFVYPRFRVLKEFYTRQTKKEECD